MFLSVCGSLEVLLEVLLLKCERFGESLEAVGSFWKSLVVLGSLETFS